MKGSHYTETSKWICAANQPTGFYTKSVHSIFEASQMWKILRLSDNLLNLFLILSELTSIHPEITRKPKVFLMIPDDSRGNKS